MSSETPVCECKHSRDRHAGLNGCVACSCHSFKKFIPGQGPDSISALAEKVKEWNR